MRAPGNRSCANTCRPWHDVGCLQLWAGTWEPNHERIDRHGEPRPDPQGALDCHTPQQANPEQRTPANTPPDGHHTRKKQTLSSSDADPSACDPRVLNTCVRVCATAHNSCKHTRVHIGRPVQRNTHGDCRRARPPACLHRPRPIHPASRLSAHAPALMRACMTQAGHGHISVHGVCVLAGTQARLSPPTPLYPASKSSL